MGIECRSMYLSEGDRKLVAYHESGQAIVALNTEGARTIHKASIMPYGSSRGVVKQLTFYDNNLVSKKQYLAVLDVCMGGRAVEEMIFGQDHVTASASDDLKKATELAKRMITTCGMSDAIGLVHIDEAGADMQKEVDVEVWKLLRESYQRAKDLLKKHEKALDALANALLERGTLSGEDIKQVVLPFQE